MVRDELGPNPIRQAYRIRGLDAFGGDDLQDYFDSDEESKHEDLNDTVSIVSRRHAGNVGQSSVAKDDIHHSLMMIPDLLNKVQETI